MTDVVTIPEQRESAEFSRDECLAKLRRHSVGRISFTHRGLPQILPVNYAFDGTNVVIRTHEGGLLDRCCRGYVVAFEIDDYDTRAEDGWSVLVIGTASVLDAGESLRAVEMNVMSAGARDGKVFIKVFPGAISGRRVGHG